MPLEDAEESQRLAEDALDIRAVRRDVHSSLRAVPGVSVP